MITIAKKLLICIALLALAGCAAPAELPRGRFTGGKSSLWFTPGGLVARVSQGPALVFEAGPPETGGIPMSVLAAEDGSLTEQDRAQAGLWQIQAQEGQLTVDLPNGETLEVKRTLEATTMSVVIIEEAPALAGRWEPDGSPPPGYPSVFEVMGPNVVVGAVIDGRNGTLGAAGEVFVNRGYIDLDRWRYKFSVSEDGGTLPLGEVAYRKR